MKVTLVQPPMILSNVKHQLLVQPPLGMAYVGACLREAGHTVRVVDGVGEGIGRLSPFRGAHKVFGLTIDEIVERIDADTDAIGVGVMFVELLARRQGAEPIFRCAPASHAPPSSVAATRDGAAALRAGRRAGRLHRYRRRGEDRSRAGGVPRGDTGQPAVGSDRRPRLPVGGWVDRDHAAAATPQRPGPDSVAGMGSLSTRSVSRCAPVLRHAVRV